MTQQQANEQERQQPWPQDMPPFSLVDPFNRIPTPQIGDTKKLQAVITGKWLSGLIWKTHWFSIKVDSMNPPWMKIPVPGEIFHGVEIGSKIVVTFQHEADGWYHYG